MVERWAISVAIRSARTNSRAVEASRPRVELGFQKLSVEPVSMEGESQLDLLVPGPNASSSGQRFAYRNSLLLAA